MLDRLEGIDVVSLERGMGGWGLVVRKWKGERCARVVKWQGGKCRRVVKCQIGRLLVLFRSGGHKVSRSSVG